LGWKRREEAGPKLLLGLKSKRVKRKLFLIDFWIKIGLELNKGILVVEIFGEKFPENCTEFGNARMGT
jgi:hypothetical protein